MSAYRILLGLSTLLAFAAVAEAGVLAGGPMYGGTSQSSAICYVMNVGIQDVRFNSITVRTQGGGVVGGGSSSCGTVLRKGTSCNVLVPISAGSAYSCIVSLRNNYSSDNLRGTLDLRDNTNAVLVVTPLR